MDDFDIYDDLQLLQEQGKQKAEEDSQWKEKYHVALGTIEKLQTEKKELNKKIKLLETNFSSLLDTARTEIKRKDNQINELRREKDDLCFRRGVRPGGKHSHQDTVPPSSRNDNLDQGLSADYTKSCLKNAEQNKGHVSEHSGQRRNPFQGESSGRLGNSGDKSYKERNSTKHQNLSHNGDLHSVALLNTRSSLKQENTKERKTNRTDDLKCNAKELNSENIASVRGKIAYVCTTEGENAEKVMEEDILKDLKEYKKRKQCDVKKDSESEEVTLITSNEKSNMLFDALFDDLAMNNENSIETDRNLEGERDEIISDVETNKHKKQEEDHSIAEMKANTATTLDTKKNLNDLFETKPDEQKKSGPEQLNSNEMDKIGMHKSSTKMPAVDTLNIVSDCIDPVVEETSITKPALKNEFKASNESTPFKFTELDSSFYSSDEERDNEKNLKESNEDAVGGDSENKIQNRSKRNKNHSQGFNKNESTSVGHADKESKYKNIQEEKLMSRKHKSEHSEIKAAKKDSHRHSNRSKHYESLSHSKLHKHENEGRELKSRASTSNLSCGTMENESKRMSPLKNEHNLQLNKLNDYVSPEKNQEVNNVALKEIKPPSFEDIANSNKAVDGKEKTLFCKKQIYCKESASLNIDKIAETADRESAIKQDDIIANKTDKFPRNKTMDNCITEVQKPLNTAPKKIEINNTTEAAATTNKHHEDKKDNASSAQSVVSTKFPSDVIELQTQNMISNFHVISTSPRDKSKNVVKDKQQTRKGHLLKNIGSNTTFSNTKTEDEKEGVNSKENLISSDRNCVVVSEPNAQITHGIGVYSETDRMDKFGTNKSVVSEIAIETHSDDNLRQNDLRLNKANEGSIDSTMDKETASNETNSSAKSNSSIKQQLETTTENHVHNKMENKTDINTPYKVPIPERDIDENEHIEMPPLLVEEDPEDVNTGENPPVLKSNSEAVDISLPNITTENRIHHKKRMLQNSRSAEHVKENLNVESQVGEVSLLSSNHDSFTQQSIPSHGTPVDKYESNKVGLDSSNSDRVSVSEVSTESTEKCNVKERYKKKILQKYENSNKIMEKTQCDSSAITSCGTNAGPSSDSEKLMGSNRDITETPNHDLTSEKTDSEVSVCKEPIEVINKNNSLQTCDKLKDESTTHADQCEKRKRPPTTELETAKYRKVLKSHKNQQKHKQDEDVGANLKTNIQKDSIVSLVPNICDLIVPETGKEATQLSYSSESSSRVPPQNINKDQSNEISSRSLVKKEKSIDNCKENVKSFTTDNPSSLNECPVIKDAHNVLYLKRRTKGINTSKQKKMKRKLSSDSLEETEEEKTSKSKKTKKLVAKSPNKSKLLSSSSKKQIKPTGNKNKKLSTSAEEPSICELNSNLIHHNIFSNDGCPDDRNLPAICNDKDDVQYQEIEKRLSSMFQSPTYMSPLMDNVIDPKCDAFPQDDNDKILDHTINETLNKSEKSQCDTSSSSRKISVGSNDYVIETVGAHVANVFVTRKKCKKRAKIAVATV